MNNHRAFLSGAIHRWIPEISMFLMAMMLLLIPVCRAAAEISSVSDLKVTAPGGPGPQSIFYRRILWRNFSL